LLAHLEILIDGASTACSEDRQHLALRGCPRSFAPRARLCPYCARTGRRARHSPVAVGFFFPS